ncbi:MAG: type I 3-dehydroquinate dehydratase [Lachnospiraceae bacterium]|nr:type I 3-dehydroquinate dehydratase [Lachnospiraceae bacterium]
MTNNFSLPESPLIIVPITGNTAEEASEQAKALKALPADMAEVRLDMMAGEAGGTRYAECLKAVKDVLNEIPVIATVRTLIEGGEADISDDEYFSICSEIIKSGSADLIDLEISHDSSSVGELIRLAHENGMEVVASSHDFTGTPESEEIQLRLKFMEDIGADYLKLAFMPSSGDDVVRLMMETKEYSLKTERKLITMSMGELGKTSRIFGGFCGSRASFASAGRSSAPGQMDVTAVRDIFDRLYR